MKKFKSSLSGEMCVRRVITADIDLYHTFNTFLGTVEVTMDPLAAGMKPADLLRALQHAAESALQCEHIRRRVVDRAIARSGSRAPIL
jgi:hypothetical protein